MLTRTRTVNRGRHSTKFRSPLYSLYRTLQGEFDLSEGPTLKSLLLTWVVLYALHKRIEGRAPVCGSEFTSKDATLQGGPSETAAGLNAKLWSLVVAVTDWCRATPY
jgi:hypothetical protein